MFQIFGYIIMEKLKKNKNINSKSSLTLFFEPFIDKINMFHKIINATTFMIISN